MTMIYAVWGMAPTIILVQVGAAIADSNLFAARVLVSLGIVSLLAQAFSLTWQITKEWV